MPNSSVDDLCLLNDINQNSIVECLKYRFESNLVYTRISDGVLVAINSDTDHEHPQDLQKYVAEYKSTALSEPLPPHLFRLSNEAYLHMRRTGIDQSIVLRGRISNRSKHISYSILSHLLALNSPKKESKFQNQILSIQPILSAFGYARSTNNQPSIQFGEYMELQFNERGRMVGCKLLDYLLDKKRVSQNREPECNFNIFYMFLKGSSVEEKAALCIQEHTIYQYARGNYSYSTEEAMQQYNSLKSAMKQIGLGKRIRAQIMQLIAAILHLGQLQFMNNSTTQETAYIKNEGTLEIVSQLLGVDESALENVLTYNTTLIKNDITTVILNAKQAQAQCDQLASLLYSLLFTWFVEQINFRLCSDTFHTFISILNFPERISTDCITSIDRMHLNYSNERIQHHMLQHIFETRCSKYTDDGFQLSKINYKSSVHCVNFFDQPHLGLIDIMEDVSRKSSKSNAQTDGGQLMMEAVTKHQSDNPAFEVKNTNIYTTLFVIDHYNGRQTYNPQDFVQSNRSKVNPDFVALFRGSEDMTPSTNSLLVNLFQDQSILVELHPKNTSTILNAQQTYQPKRKPSKRCAAPKTAEKEKKATPAVFSQLRTSLDDLMATLSETVPWFIFCVQPYQTAVSSIEPILKFNSQLVQSQVESMNLVVVAQRLKTGSFMNVYAHDEFCERYAAILPKITQERKLKRDKCQAALEMNNLLNTGDTVVGNTKVFLNNKAWRVLEDKLRVIEKDGQRKQRESRIPPALSSPSIMEDIRSEHLSDQASYSVRYNSFPNVIEAQYNQSNVTIDASVSSLSHYPSDYTNKVRPSTYSIYSEDQPLFFSDDMYNQQHHEVDSQIGAESFSYSPSKNHEVGKFSEETKETEKDEEEEQKTVSSTRKRWLVFVWLMTWWIPNCVLSWCGRMKRKDIQIAWREKLALCMLIFLMSGFVIWFLVFFGKLVCPHQDVFSLSELQAHNKPEKAYVTIRGEVFDLTKFAPHHWASQVIPANAILSYAGKDVSDLFPVQVSALCEGVDGRISDFVSLDYHFNLTDTNSNYHDFRAWTNDSRPDWYFEKMVYLRKNYKIGTMGFTNKEVHRQATTAVDVGGMKSTRVWAILNGSIYDLTYYVSGGRHIQVPAGMTIPNDVNTNYMSDIVVNLFRQKSGEDISQYWSALPLDPQLRRRQERDPQSHDKFIICQVPCYTEGEEELKKTIDSIAALQYDDKRKLLFIICDGMIVGGGNDRPTPRIVLDILGVDSYIDPEPLSFFSIGEGHKQHNMGKIYSGLYECQGHVVPYIVVSKVGKPSERQKPGNRGKRDSQLILMRFLNKVHFNAPMTPMELEMFHQIKNVIGVDPSFYEYVLMVDADTEVFSDGLNKLVSSFVHDAKIIGLCGETKLSNEKDTWVTMIQVYEYFISHYMIKAFESLFGSVTCLPGCFCMYRIRSSTKNQPLLVSNQVIEDYQTNKVDTLHKKNLLHLGEDRYLTTLILKHFPTYKTKFVSDAKCATNAPDQWSVLLSQRRRWINSTIHNLGELVFLPQLCGFCCFSMRFVVMLDLISTLVQPAIVGYLIYLIYTLSTTSSNVPLMSIITIAGVYGLQAIIFIIHKKWEHIIWMIVSIFAIPVFSFYIPIYAYWHFDDFSWGNTRVVLGDKGKKMVVGADEGKFDPKSIPTMTWEKYEEGMYPTEWNQHNSDTMSVGSQRSRHSFNSYVSHHSNKSRHTTHNFVAKSYIRGSQSVIGMPLQSSRSSFIYSNARAHHSVASGINTPRQFYSPTSPLKRFD
ncbi:chitin synthase-domain-containing protein [Blakeslea trispora]|nr:chitin synthase-domain-containing protein [Blakeslea trispora]